jgi:hypothetical protein
MQHTGDAGLGGGAQDLAAVEVEVGPAALEELGFPRAGVDQQRREDAKPAVPVSQRSRTQGVDLLAGDLNPSDGFLKARDAQGG